LLRYTAIGRLSRSSISCGGTGTTADVTKSPAGEERTDPASTQRSIDRQHAGTASASHSTPGVGAGRRANPASATGTASPPSESSGTNASGRVSVSGTPARNSAWIRSTQTGTSPGVSGMACVTRAAVTSALRSPTRRRFRYAGSSASSSSHAIGSNRSASDRAPGSSGSASADASAGDMSTTTGAGIGSENQTNPCGASVSRYGSSPIFGNGVRPKISSGATPAYSRRSSSANCTNRDRLATTRMRSSWYLRMNASTFAFAGRMNSSDPRPNALNRFRSAMIRFIHHRRELGLFCWASTLIAS
jgi:hypothetical protein